MSASDALLLLLLLLLTPRLNGVRAVRTPPLICAEDDWYTSVRSGSIRVAHCTP